MAQEDRLISLLEDKLKEVDELSQKYDIDRIEQWKNEVLMILDNLLEEESKYYKQIDNLNFWPQVILRSDDDNSELKEEAYKRDIESAKSTIKSIIYGIKNHLLQ